MLIQEKDNLSTLAPRLTCPIVDFSSIGQHFLLKSTSHPSTLGGSSPAGDLDHNKGGIKRQYTQAFCMISTIYDNLVKLGLDPSDSTAAAEISNVIEEANPECCYLTIKNYAAAGGLSHFVH
jgi:hypothetical protein